MVFYINISISICILIHVLISFIDINTNNMYSILVLVIHGCITCIIY